MSIVDRLSIRPPHRPATLSDLLATPFPAHVVFSVFGLVPYQHSVNCLARRVADRSGRSRGQKHRTMASELLARTKGKRKLFDRPQRWLRCLNDRVAKGGSPAAEIETPVARTSDTASNTAAGACPTETAASQADTGQAAKYLRPANSHSAR